MSAVTNMWRQLVQRRLWPVAILLIAALVAVPLTLAKEPEAAPAPPPAPAPGNDELAVAPIVTAVSTEDRDKRRHVLGRAKNPFAVVKPEKQVVRTADASRVTRSADVAPAGEPAATVTGGATPMETSAPVTETPATPAPPAKTYDKYDLTVRFGEAASGSGRETLKRLQPLPSAEQPVLIYLGVGENGRTAIFLLDHGVEAIGDGICKPSPDECETLRLRAGETEFLDVKDAAGNVTAQYQLDLVKIHKSTTTSAAEAKASYAGSKAGRRLLRARVSSDGPVAYRWNDATGTLERRAEAAVVGTVERAVAQLP